MSFAQILEEVDRLSEEERRELSRRLRARELAGDPKRTENMSARLDKTLAGMDVVTEDQFHAKLRTRGFAQP